MRKTYKPEHMHLTEVIGIKIAKADKLLLERAAIERYTSVSQLVREAIREVVLYPAVRREEGMLEHER